VCGSSLCCDDSSPEHGHERVQVRVDTLEAVAAAQPPMLELNGVHKRFGGLHAVNNVSFKVAPGSIKAVIGPNGAGKTTLFNLIAGNLPVSAGSILFQGRDIQGKKTHQIARLGMARTFQNIKLFHGMSVLECVMVGRHMQSRSGFFAGMFSLPSTWKEETGQPRTFHGVA
jgi:branched-chain amino acid transport system ATP-binding protein